MKILGFFRNTIIHLLIVGGLFTGHFIYFKSSKIVDAGKLSSFKRTEHGHGSSSGKGVILHVTNDESRYKLAAYPNWLEDYGKEIQLVRMYGYYRPNLLFGNVYEAFVFGILGFLVLMAYCSDWNARKQKLAESR